MKDDFDNRMGLPEDELTGGSAMSEPGDLGLGGIEDEMDVQAPGRPSGGARTRKSSGSRPRKRAAAPARRKAPKKRSAAKGARKKGATKVARKAARKGSARKRSKKATRGRMKKGGRRR